MSSSGYKKPTTIKEAYSNPRYQGKIVIESPEGLYSTTDGDRAFQTLQRLNRKFPSTSMKSTVIPKGLMITLPYTFS